MPAKIGEPTLQTPVQSAVPLLEREVLRARLAEQLFGDASNRPLIGGYRLLRCVGRGGMGVVFEASPADGGDRLAIKVLRGTGPRALKRLKSEFRALRGLYHPNLVQLRELSLEPPDPFLTMEFVDGGAWLDYVKPDRHLQPDRLDHVFRQLIDAVSTLHAAGVVHRDLKPSNVLVEPNGRLVVLDFGLARAVDELESLARGTSGTPRYMSPERLRGEAVGPASDWYSVGMMLLDALDGPHPSDVATEHDGAGALRELSKRLLADDPSRRPSGPDLREYVGLARTTQPSIVAPQLGAHTVFVGRETELAQLNAAFMRSRGGNCVVVCVSGEPGIGKSALVRRALHEWRQRHAVTVLSARCYERESIAYNAIDGLVDALVRELERMPLGAGDLAQPRGLAELIRLFPVAASLSTNNQPAEAAAQDPRRVRQRACDALCALVQSATAHNPVVLHLDDLQWADADSAQMLESFLQGIEKVPLLLIASYRTADAEHSAAVRTLQEFRRSRSQGGDELVLHGLNADRALDLGRALCADRFSEHELCALIADAKGKPLFVSMLARYGTPEVAPRTSDATSPVLPRDEESSSGLALHQLLAAVAAQVPAEARVLLELSALAGCPLDAERLLQAARELSGHARWAERLSLLQAAGLLRSIRVPNGRAFECFHDRLREVVAAGIEAAHRRNCHGALAQAAARATEPDSDFLAIHYEAAGEVALAAEHAERAGDQAFNMVALERAAARYEQALRLRGGERPAALVHKLAETIACSGRCAAASPLYLEVADGSDAAQALRLRLRAAEMLLRTGAMRDYVEVVRPVLAAVGLKYPSDGLATRAGMFFSLLYLRWKGTDFTSSRAASTPIDQLRIDVCLTLGAIQLIVDTGRGCALMLRGMRLVHARGSEVHFAQCLAFYALVHASLGKSSYEEQEAWISRAVHMAQGHPEVQAWVLFMRAVMYYMNTRFRLALSSLRSAQTWIAANCVDSGWLIDELQAGACAQLNMIGQLVELEENARTALQHSLAKDNALQTFLTRCNRGFLSLVADNPAAAITEADACVLGCEQMGGPVASFAIIAAAFWLKLHALLYLGAGAAALRFVRESRRQFARAGFAKVQPWMTVLPVFAGTAALAAARTRRSRAIQRVLDDSIASLAKLPWDFAIPSLHLLKAGRASLNGRRTLAATLYGSAAQEYEVRGLAGYAACARMRQAELVEGEAHHALRQRALAWFEAQGVVRPELWTRMYAPIEPSDQSYAS